MLSFSHCTACTCNTLGTKANRGCDHATGKCECKNNVIGRDCDRCRENYYGIDEGLEGCKPCDCDPGGSLSAQCDLKTGQCICRPHITGRRCDQPAEGYFVPQLDHLRYEAENAIMKSPDARTEIREVSRVSDRTWTGDGFVYVTDRSSLEFEINNVPTLMQYDVIVRYESQLSRPVRARILIETIESHISHSGLPSKNVTCTPRGLHQQEFRQIELHPHGRFVSTNGQADDSGIGGPVCLSPGQSYKIRISFEPVQSGHSWEASDILLIDSFVITPVTSQLAPFDPAYNSPESNYNVDRKLQEYKHYRCEEQLRHARKPAAHQVCDQLQLSAGMAVFNGARACECDQTGSLDTSCAQLGGQCKCRANVLGRRCDHCAAGFWNFGPNGCESCDCHPSGSRNKICNVRSGACLCNENAHGQKCDSCGPGSWGWPDCRPCSCNLHAQFCDSKTGFCQDCADHTDGNQCERCVTGYYGHPIIGSELPCRACPCPGVPESGLYHATGCKLDARTSFPICACKPGYTGERCDRCADNYWGDATILGSECRRCECNGNADLSEAGACDAQTGRCLRCLYQTDGDHCEHCRAGFYGDASKHDCRPCDCYAPGTNSSAGAPCDGVSGQCFCLPGVTGKRCDQCEADKWDLASGKGCKACDCDTAGSTSSQCNLLDGQCECSPGYGGKHCNECQKDYYGDPAKQCYCK